MTLPRPYKETCQRVNIIATFEIPGGKDAYRLFRLKVELAMKLMERDLGAEAFLEYAALEIKSLDTIVRD